MIAFLAAHSVVILTCLLTISELLAFVFPKAGGILKAVMQGLRALGAKDVDGQ